MISTSTHTHAQAQAAACLAREGRRLDLGVERSSAPREHGRGRHSDLDQHGRGLFYLLLDPAQPRSQGKWVETHERERKTEERVEETAWHHAQSGVGVGGGVEPGPERAVWRVNYWGCIPV